MGENEAAIANDGDSDAGLTDSLMRLLDANILSPSLTLDIEAPSKKAVLITSKSILQEIQVTPKVAKSTVSSPTAPEIRVPSDIRQLPKGIPTQPKAMEEYEKRKNRAIMDKGMLQKSFRTGSSTPQVLTHETQRDEPRKRKLRGCSFSPPTKRRNSGGFSRGARESFLEWDHWSPPHENILYSPPPPRRRAYSPPMFSYNRSLPLPLQRECTATIPVKKIEPQSTPKKMGIPQARAAAAAAAAVSEAPEYPSLASLENTECYNCMRKGHVFMDCTFGCGKCGEKGHRTIDCSILCKR